MANFIDYGSTSSVNRNTETGIRFGVIDGNSVPDLLSEIQDNGTDNAYDEFVSDLVSTIRDHLSDSTDLEEVRASVRSAINDYCLDAESIVDEHLDSATALLDVDNTADLIVDSVMQNYEWDSEQSEFSYESGGAKFELSNLGGAPLIFVLQSQFVCYAKPCSPCVPGAGDLNNIVQSADDGVLTYCINPDDMQSGAVDEIEPRERFEIWLPMADDIGERTIADVCAEISESATLGMRQKWAEVLNFGEWKRHYLIGIAIANALNPMFVVSADCESDALDEFADSERYGHLIKTDETDFQRDALCDALESMDYATSRKLSPEQVRELYTRLELFNETDETRCGNDGALCNLDNVHLTEITIADAPFIFVRHREPAQQVDQQ